MTNDNSFFIVLSSYSWCDTNAQCDMSGIIKPRQFATFAEAEKAAGDMIKSGATSCYIFRAVAKSGKLDPPIVTKVLL